ncbi:LysR family transcriptional regulator [Roseobacter sp. N2S]|uniref:LysR family transcriptional regulator n=1 Tax=Roseobacter sp. N2S TaxID=2663844 RepID=UPI00286B2E0D|nr:LysR family transcriptional regulator [Roseobacter sp. N2S]
MIVQGGQMNLRHLRAFVEVCNHGGISAASGAVHLSQPAITQAIAKLEEGFGLPLFTRSSKGMFATAAAKILLHRAQRAFDMLKSAAPKVPASGQSCAAGAYVDLLTSTQLRALIAVAAYGNFSVAARVNGVSQPSLYRTAKSLEALAGQSFYIKSSKGIDLSPAALILVRAARLAFAELDQAITDIAHSKGETTGILRLGSLPLSRGTILPPALNRLAQIYPRLNVQVSDGSYDEMLHGLRHGEIDLLLGALRDPAPAPDVIQEPLFEDHLGVFCGPNHPLVGQPVPGRAELAGYSWVVTRGGSPTRAHFDRFFADLDLSDPQGARRGAILESNALILIRELLQGSERLAMISANQLRSEVAIGGLHQLPIVLNDKPRPIGMTYRADWQPTKTQSELLCILRETAVAMG